MFLKAKSYVIVFIQSYYFRIGALMVFDYDDNLIKFEMEGALPLPKSISEGYIENAGARIWYATYGDGHPVVLLHGGLGNFQSGLWVLSILRVIWILVEP